MSTVEAAASLFGSDDQGPDPFAAIGNEERDTTSTAYLAAHDDGQHTSSSYPYNMGQDASNLFSSEEMPSHAQNSQYEPWSPPAVQDSTPAYSQDLNASSYGQAQGLYDQHAQWLDTTYPSVDSQQPGQETFLADSHAVPADYGAPYVPITNDTSSTYAPPSSNPYAPPTQPQPLYDPPNPPTSNYVPAQGPTTPYSPPAYDPYKAPSSRTQRAVSQPQSSVPYSGAPKSYASNVVPAQPPPAPSTASAAAYRPKTFNAYDPPLPPPKPSKRAVSARVPRSLSPAKGQQSYASYDIPAQSTPPLPVEAQSRYVPPSSPSNFPQHAQNSYGVGGHAMGEMPPRQAQGPSVAHADPSYFPSGAYYGDGHTGHYGADMPSKGDFAQYQPSSPPPASHGYNPSEQTHHISNGASDYEHRDHDYPQLSQEKQLETNEYVANSLADEIPWGNSELDYAEGIQAPSSFVDENRRVGTASDEHVSTLRSWEGDFAAPASNGDPVYGHAYADVKTHPYGSIDLTPSSPPRSSSKIGSPNGRDTTSYNGRDSPKAESVHSRSGSNSSHGYSPKQLLAQRAVSPERATVERNGSMHSKSGSGDSQSRVSISSATRRAISPERGSLGRTGSPYMNPSQVQQNNMQSSEGKVPSIHSSEPSGVSRASSPHSVRSLNGPQNVRAYPYMPPKPAANPYDPHLYDRTDRASSPGSTSLHSRQDSPKPDPYAPPKSMVSKIPPEIRTRSGSDGSTFSSISATLEATNHRNDYGSLPSRYMHPPHGQAGPYGNTLNHVQEHSLGQDLYGSPPTHASYAPSPSLLGSNDPLGRTSTRAPIITFGFGGKLVTCFHGSFALSTGFDVALSSRRSTDVQIRLLHKVVPESTFGSTVVYPGPLFSDPGTPTTSLVRTGASTQLKAKRASVVKYLDERAEELSHGLGYFDADSVDKRHAEGKLVLVRLLKVMVENDGALSGSAQIDTAVRAALLPRLATSLHKAPNGSAGLAPSSFSSPIPDMHAMGMRSTISSETPISISTLLPSALDKIQEFLIRGERRQAYHFALDEKLWAHAMVIASSIDKDSWKEVVSEFVKTELGVKGISAGSLLGTRAEDAPPASNGREWLRVAYSLFSGQGPAAVQEFVPTNLLSRAAGSLQVPVTPMAHATPMSPNFSLPIVPGKVPLESLSKWPETAAVMVSSPMPPDWSAAFTALGDFLASHQWIEAAHACYLLAPQTSTMGGVGSPSTRVVLLGSPAPQTSPAFHRDSDPIIFSEIVEFAMSLKPVTKGQDAFHGLPHLQAYKLIRASALAELGHVQLASRYCEAITGSLGRSSPYINTAFLEQMRGLADRLVGAPHVEKPGSWIGGKMSKPSLDSIGNWLEGRLTKFIAGEGDAPASPIAESTHTEKQAFSGPFSHYSTISSATTSASPSPQPSMVNLHAMSNTPPPRRSGSAMALQSSAPVPVQIDRASSAMEYYRPTRNISPAPRTVPPNVTSMPYGQIPYGQTAYGQTPYGQGTNGHAPANGYVSSYSAESATRKSSLEVTEEEGDDSRGSGWWASSQIADSSAPTPTAGTFHQVADLPASTDGFISLMDNHSLAVAPSSADYRQANHFADEDDDDLGLGNSTSKREGRQNSATENGTGNTGHSEMDASPSTQVAEKSDARPPAAPPAAASGSWLSRFWKRSDAPPAPVKASLGEETSFYYDKDLKRWVNKKAGAEAEKPAAPLPPPSRARTTSPATMSENLPSGMGPARSMSAGVELNAPPSNKPPMRVRSSLVPTDIASMPNTPAASAAMAPPPPGRPRSQATKRPVRNRYVDVFQQPENGA